MIILIIQLTLINAKDYFISFDFSSTDYVLRSYNFNCSAAMTNDNNQKYIFLFEFPTRYKNISDVCKFNQAKIIKYLLKYKFHISSNETKKNNYLFSRIKGVFLPKRFDIIIKNGFVKFYLKE